MVSYFSTVEVYFIITFTVYVDSACYQGQLVAQITKYGTPDIRCIFNNITVSPGSSFKLPAPDCIQCTCSAKSMTCCGYGFAAGPVTAPTGCVAHNDACKLIFVKQNKPTEVCKPAKGATPSKKKSGAQKTI